MERLVREVSKREAIPADSINSVQDVASSFGDRKGVNKLVDAMLDGRVRVIYCEFANRLSRIPALTRLIEHLAKRTNVKIVCLDKEDTDDNDKGIDFAEIIDYFTVVSNRASAAKSRKVTVKHVADETIARMAELWASGHSLQAIRKVLVAEGHTTKTEQGTITKTWSEYKVRLCLQSIADTKGATAKATHPFIDFCSAHLVIAETWDCNQRIDCDEIYTAYKRFCVNRGVECQPKASVFQRFATNSILPDVKARRQRSMNRVFLRGVSLA
jgi:hypothetical protein